MDGQDGDTDWYVAEYGVTTFDQVLAALVAGKFVVAYDPTYIGHASKPLFATYGPYGSASGYIYFSSPAYYAEDSAGHSKIDIHTLEYGTNTWSRLVQVEIPLEPSDIGAIDSNQGSGNAGKFMVVGSDGNITAVTMQTWQGGSY
jgi:hypothetical protein